jgi:MscS family membrane protein
LQPVRRHVAFWVVALLISLMFGLAHAAHATDNHPLRPPDTSSPRATLSGFIETTDDIYRVMRDVLESYAGSGRLFLDRSEHKRQVSALKNGPKAAEYLDLSNIPPVLRDTVTVERLVQLKEILDRIDIPSPADIPDQEQMARSATKRWRLPNTEIDIVLIDKGPRAGEYLVSAATVDRLPEFYDRIKDLPYKPGLGEQLDAAYRALSGGGSGTIYDGLLNSPVGLSFIIPPRWMLVLPQWAKDRVLGAAAWQWLGLGVGLVIGALVILAGHRIGRRSEDEAQDVPARRWQSLALPLAIIVVAGLLVPMFCTMLRIGGIVRIILDYGATGALYVAVAWLAIVVSVLIGELLVASERLTPRSLDNQLIRLGARLLGLVAMVAILIRAGDELGFPAYSVVAGLGVGGLAVALAAQTTIANLIGSMLIALEKPFRVGHFVKIGGSEGTVEDVGFRSTRIRTADNALVTIPSSTVVNSTVENLTLRPKRRQRFFVQVTYDTPREKLEELIAGIGELIADHPLAEAHTCQARLNNLGESSLDILVIFHLLVEDYTAELREREAVLLRIIALVERLGIALAFPTRTLYLEGAAESLAARPAQERATVGFIARS